MGQWGSTDSPQINPHTCGQLTFNRGGKNTQGETTASSNLWKSGTAACKSLRSEHTLNLDTKTDSQ